MEWRVSGFSEIRELGAGAQGRVVLARHEESGSPVAVKYLAAGASEAERERLRHEAQMLARADSPHIARLYRLVESDQGSALIMEAVDGVSLKVVLEHHGALGPEAALAVLKGALLGLAAAHSLGVVHRDFKPANVVVPEDGRSRLVDFGIAVPAGELSRGAGTPVYMAPEQWERNVATPATDVYAATCVFVECATGRRPFDASGVEALRAAHMTAPVPVEGVPEPLRPLVETGMAKDPAQRSGSAAAFVEQLDRVARDAYGDDWEVRGVRALAGSAAALAALFPLAAVLAPGAGVAAGGAATAATGGAGGHAAASAGTAAAGKGFFASGAGIAAAAATGTVLVVGGGVFAVDRLGDDTPRRAAAAPSARPVTVTPVACRNLRPGSSSAPIRPVTIPAQVRMPSGARMYASAFGGTAFIGPAGTNCESSNGINTGFDRAEAGRQMVSIARIGSAGGSADTVCEFFPTSRAAQAGRPTGCEPRRAATPIPTGVPNRLVAFQPQANQGVVFNGSYVFVALATMTDRAGGSTPSPITCQAGWEQRELCVAALTHQALESLGSQPKATLDAVAQRIRTAVEGARQEGG